MRINNVRMINIGSLICSFELEFENWGITIRGCTMLKGKNGNWLSLPIEIAIFEKEKRQDLESQVLSRLKTHIDKEEA